MKPDEQALARVVLESQAHDRGPGFVAEGWWLDRGYPEKRLWRLLEKWERKGWWEYGVSLRGGWLTETGRAALTAATAQVAG